MSRCNCPRFSDTGGFRIADLTCPVHGVSGTDPGDGYWDDGQTIDIGHVHVMHAHGAGCVPHCPHPDHRANPQGSDER